MTTQQLPPDIGAGFPQFREPGLRDLIAAHGRVHHFSAGATLIDFGDPLRMMPLVLDGSIKVSRQSDDAAELFLYYLTAGESCAMTFDCSLADKRSEIRAVAEEDTRILGLPLSLFVDCMRFASWQQFVLQSYSRRMNELIFTVDQVAFCQLDVRLHDYLRKRAALRDDQTVHATHRDIANDLNVSREAVSRLLKMLEQRGTVQLGRNLVRLTPAA
ncbi:Crp/Fnr family transcriptional regulator [Lewinella sp. IMCC34183]|uniref:Crp/Fnr family transcriptional regulator n=1 Tax=Lewinella sp. IMCC34183 TaxID=2248762 RepID=UPI000E252820|nr:Crp/Fnr family transcriptional regulator [Lewinella sp. IMCC34183]